MEKQTKEENLNQGHRQRMREKFRSGRENMQDHEILEMLLYVTIPRINTNIQAHELIRKAGGTLGGVLELDETVIKAIPGIGDKSAEFFQLLEEFYRRIKKEKLTFTNRRKITKENIIQKVRQHFVNFKEEKLIMITATSEMNQINSYDLIGGTDTSAVVPVKKIMKLALEDKAMFVILAHNHPSGIPAPTQEDIDATRVVREALGYIDVALVNHYVVTESTAVAILKDNK